MPGREVNDTTLLSMFTSDITDLKYKNCIIYNILDKATISFLRIKDIGEKDHLKILLSPGFAMIYPAKS